MPSMNSDPNTTDTLSATIEYLRNRETELARDMDGIEARLQEVRDTLGMLLGTADNRPRQPRKRRNTAQTVLEHPGDAPLDLEIVA
jgi:hypothetical protein